MPNDKDREPFVEHGLAREHEVLGFGPDGIPTTALQPKNARAIGFLRPDYIEGQCQAVLVPVNDVGLNARRFLSLRRHRDGTQETGSNEGGTDAFAHSRGTFI